MPRQMWVLAPAVLLLGCAAQAAEVKRFRLRLRRNRLDNSSPSQETGALSERQAIGPLKRFLGRGEPSALCYGVHLPRL